MLTQMYATLNYIQQRHPYGSFPGQESQSVPPPPPPKAEPALTNGSAVDTNGADANGVVKKEKKEEEEKKPEGAATHVPDRPEVFEATMREMARSLILQEQKAEILINSLPGIGNSEQNQLARMTELETELKQAEAERVEAEKKRERMVDTLGDVLVGIKSVP